MSQEWTIPLQIRISLGTPGQGAQLAAAPAVGPQARVERGAPLAKRALPPSHGSLESTDPYLDKFNVASLKAKDFNYRTALSMALASRLAYADKATVEGTAKNLWKLQTCEFVSVEETQCFVATSPDAVLLAFRGTENLGDWLANMNMMSTVGSNPSYGRVHGGFLGAFIDVKAALEKILDPLAGRPLLITGHSLGGALALIAAAEWQGKYNISWIHTHGQPAVGKKDFQVFMETHYGRVYYRFVNDDDIVPMVPPSFSHSGYLVHFGEGDGLESLAGSPELEAVGVDPGLLPVETPMLTKEQFDLLRARLLQERALGETLDEGAVEAATLESVAGPEAGVENLESLEGLLPSISDHSMDLYVAKIARQLEQRH
jgi:hypothetical protein